MKLLKSGVIFVILVSLFVMAGCGAAKQEVTLGEMENNSYSNEYFGLTLDVPESWTVLSQEEIADLNSVSQDIIGENNQDLAERMDLGEEKTLNLIYSFKFPLTYLEGFNPNFMLMAENLSLLEGMVVKSGSDYLDVLKDLLGQTGIPYEFADLSKEEVGGIEFDVLTAQINVGEGLIVEQQYYSALKNGYALSFIISYSSAEELAELEAILDTIQFED